MEISRHRTRAIFDRYNITSEVDLRAAMRTVTLPSLLSEPASISGSFRGVKAAGAPPPEKRSPQDLEILGAFWLRGLDLN